MSVKRVQVKLNVLSHWLCAEQCFCHVFSPMSLPTRPWVLLVAYYNWHQAASGGEIKGPGLLITGASFCPANTRCWLNAAIMLARRLRRRPNIKATSGQRFVFVGCLAKRIVHVKHLLGSICDPQTHMLHISVWGWKGMTTGRYNPLISRWRYMSVTRKCLFSILVSTIAHKMRNKQRESF